MVSSAKLALFAFLQDIRSISLGRNLKAFILRCVLLWPRILHNSRKVWSWYFQTSSRDQKKTKGDIGWPSSPGTMEKREECVVVCASEAFGGVGGPSRHSVLRSSNPEQSIRLEDGIPSNSSMPHPLSSSYAPQQDTPWLPATTRPSGSSHTSVRSFRTGSSVGSVNSRLNAPVPWTHSRATAGQFTGMTSRSRSCPPSRCRPNTPTRHDPHILTPPTMTHDSQGPLEDSISVSIPISPRDRSRLLSPFRRHFSRPNTPTSPNFDIPTPPTMAQDLQGSSPGNSASGISIQIEQPSRPASPETTESMNNTSRPQLLSRDDLTQSFPTSQHTPHEFVNSSEVTSDLEGHSPSMSVGHIGAKDSKESIQDPLTSQPTQTPQITFPVPSTSRRLTNISTTNDVTQRTPSVPHSRAPSHAPSPQGSPKLPAIPLPLGNSHTLASSLRAESPRLPPVQGRTSFQAPFSLRLPLTFPEPSFPHPLTPASTANASNYSFRPDTHTVRPMHSDQVSRYVKKGDVTMEKSNFRLLPMDVDLPHSYQFHDSGDWTPVTHPGGALYFYHKIKRIFTDVYMYDSNLRGEVEKSVQVLEANLFELEYSETPFKFPTANYDLVLDIVETEDKKIIRQYYFVDHDTKMLFWLDYYNMRTLLFVPGVTEPGHIKHRLESLYWVHWSLYPAGHGEERKFPDDAYEKLMGFLLGGSIDLLTSKVSTAPYSVADMQTMCDIINKTKDLGSENPDSICSVARLLSMCAQWRFVHFHGQKTSRQDRHKSIYKDAVHKRTKPFRVLSMILFFTPDVHLRELKRVWTDDLIVEEIWRCFMEKLVSEWIEFVLYSTVMLAVNVGFLAIQGIKTSAQIASSVSLVFSLGSIITGLLLIRRNRDMAMQDPRTACDYLVSLTKLFYLEPLAVIFSLTYALLMWSVFVFFIALLLFSFQNTTTEIRAIVGVPSGIVIILILWCIVTSWDSSISDSEKDGLIDILPEDERPAN